MYEMLAVKHFQHFPHKTNNFQYSNIFNKKSAFNPNNKQVVVFCLPQKSYT